MGVITFLLKYDYICPKAINLDHAPNAKCRWRAMIRDVAAKHFKRSQNGAAIYHLISLLIDLRTLMEENESLMVAINYNSCNVVNGCWGEPETRLDKMAWDGIMVFCGLQFVISEVACLVTWKCRYFLFSQPYTGYGCLIIALGLCYKCRQMADLRLSATDMQLANWRRWKSIPPAQQGLGSFVLNIRSGNLGIQAYQLCQGWIILTANAIVTTVIYILQRFVIIYYCKYGTQ